MKLSAQWFKWFKAGVIGLDLGHTSLVPRLSVGWEKEPGIYCSRMRVIIPC